MQEGKQNILKKFVTSCDLMLLFVTIGADRMYDVKEGKAPGYGWVLFLFHK